MRLPPEVPFRTLVGVGGIGSGMFVALEGGRTLGRSESRGARLVDARDYCKLHTVAHHVATLCGATSSGDPFRVLPVGVVGDDGAGARLLEEMGAAGMDASHVRVDPDRPTLFSVCFHYPDGDGGNITTVDSAASSLQLADVDAVAGVLEPSVIALAQPEVPLEPRRRLLELGRERGALTAGSFTSLELQEARARGLFELLDVVAVNEHEAVALARMDLDAESPEPFLRRCAATFGDDVRLVVTAGSRGAFAIQGDRYGRRAAPRVDVVNTAGCGDALLAGVLTGLAAGAPFLGSLADHEIDDALGLGVFLASLNATSPHTIHPAADAPAVAALVRRSGLRLSGALAGIFGEEV
jgi:sugar/nucleoside kinase (ribokinase family)